MYALYLYFLGLSFRNTSKAEPFREKRSHVAVWNWVQRFNPKIIYSRKRRVTAFVIDETMIQIGERNEAWLWIAIEPVRSTVLGVYLSKHRNMLVAESFLRSSIEIYGRHIVYSDGDGTWYSEACSSLELKHRLHTSSEKSLIERAIQYFKDRTEHFDDYYPCIRFGCDLSHVYRWLAGPICIYA